MKTLSIRNQVVIFIFTLIILTVFATLGFNFLIEKHAVGLMPTWILLLILLFVGSIVGILAFQPFLKKFDETVQLIRTPGVQHGGEMSIIEQFVKENRSHNAVALLTKRNRLIEAIEQEPYVTIYYISIERLNWHQGYEKTVERIEKIVQGIKEHFKERGQVYRMLDNEFVVLLPSNQENNESNVEAIRSIINNFENLLSLKIYIGVSNSNQMVDNNPEQLLKEAHMAMIFNKFPRPTK